MGIRRTAFLTPELPDDEVEREIVSIGRVRFDRKTRDYQFHLTLRETGSAAESRLWMPLKRLSFFPAGSLWRSQRPISKGVAPTVVIKPNLLGPARTVRASTLLKAGAPASTLTLSSEDQDFHLLELEDEAGVPVLVPMPELLRQHYFFDPRMLPDIAGGLMKLGLTSSVARQSWDPKHTGWIDAETGIARIRVARHVEHREAFRLARLLFSPAASHSLRVLGDFLHRLKLAGDRRDLPLVTLPYVDHATWTGKAVPFGINDQGQQRLLIRSIEQFSAPPPWKQLVVEQGIAHTKTSKDQANPSPSAGGARLLEPLIREPLPTVVKPTEPSGTALRTEVIENGDVEANDFDAGSSLTRPASSGGQAGKGVRKVFDEAGTDAPGAGGEGRAALLAGFGKSQAVDLAEGTYDIRDILDVLQAQMPAELTFSGRYLPSRDEWQEYLVEVKGTRPRSRNITYSSRFTIYEIDLAGRCVYVIDPVRAAGIHHPIGVLSTGSLAKIAPEALGHVARHFIHKTHVVKGSWVEPSFLLPKDWCLTGIHHPKAQRQWGEHSRITIKRIIDEVTSRISTVI